MNRYDYYTRCVNIDEQEWLIEELYYPEQEEDTDYDGYSYTPSYSNEYEEEDYGDEDTDYDGLYGEDEDGREYSQDEESSCGQYTSVPAGGGASA